MEVIISILLTKEYIVCRKGTLMLSPRPIYLFLDHQKAAVSYPKDTEVHALALTFNLQKKKRKKKKKKRNENRSVLSHLSPNRFSFHHTMNQYLLFLFSFYLSIYKCTLIYKTFMIKYHISYQRWRDMHIIFCGW